MQYSLEKSIIVEEFIKKKGYQIDGDIFMIDGKIVFWGICDQHHDEYLAPYVPVGLSFPSTQPKHIQEEAKRQLEKIFSLLHMHMGAYNIEYIVDANDRVYILEIGPRNGGNYIPNVIKLATGFDMATNTVRQAVGDDCIKAFQSPLINPATSYLIHSQKDGILKSVDISDETNPFIIETLWCDEIGSKVKAFNNAGGTIGYMLLSFDDVSYMCDVIDNMNNFIKVNVL